MTDILILGELSL